MMPAETETKPTVTGTGPSSRGETSGSLATEKTQGQAAAVETQQLIFTTNVDGGEILSVEKVDKSGSRSELSEEECGKIAGEDEIDEIDAALDTAFEAGIVEALGDEDVPPEQTTGEDPVLERLILLRLLGRRVGRVHAVRRNMLRRLLLRRLIRRRMLRNRKERTT